MTFSDTAFWLALMQIIGINIVLSGDNAVVIALAARSLPPKQQKQAVMWGSGAAVVMRIVLTFLAVEMLKWPYLKLIGAVLLLWIGIQLLLPEDEHGEGKGTENAGMAAAVRTILIADLVMSLDNVIAVAAAAKGSATLLIIGLVISIPMVVFGSTLLMKFMERWPIIITIGGALLGWVAGEMAVTDPLVKAWVDTNAAWLHYGGPALGAILVVVVGKLLAKRAADREETHPVIDLATPTDQHAPAAAAAAVAAAKRVLLAADDTPASMRGVERFLADLRTTRESVAVDLLNVQTPVHRDVAIFVAEAAIKSLHHDEGLKALAKARSLLEQAGLPVTVHIGVGDFNHVVAHYAKSLNATRVVLTETARTESGSAQWVGQHVSVPVA